jgi:hypothetical protein
MDGVGAEKIWTRGQSLHISAGQHQAGTCRMGNDPKTSVTDSWGRVHAHDNLYVIDGYSHSEISQLMRIPIGTSKSNLSRARLLLQKSIKKTEEIKLCRI